MCMGPTCRRTIHQAEGLYGVMQEVVGNFGKLLELPTKHLNGRLGDLKG